MEGIVNVRTKKQIDALKLLYRLCVKALYSSELPIASVCIVSNKRKIHRINVTEILLDGKRIILYDILFSETLICGDFSKICSAMVHEIAHIYCEQHGILSTNFNGKGHSQNFADIASEHGLQVQYTSSHGFRANSITAKAKKLLN